MRRSRPRSPLARGGLRGRRRRRHDGVRRRRRGHHERLGVSGIDLVRRRLERRAEAKRVPGRDRRVQQAVPERHTSSTSRSATTCRPVLSTAVAGGHPPDMADVAQPGFVQPARPEGGAASRSSTPARRYSANFAPAWLKLGTFNGKLYGIVFKASNKSTVWYNVHAFKDAGVKPPTDVDELARRRQDDQAVGCSGRTRSAAPTGWTLTDLFENIYLRQAGADKYNQLSEHKIKWTDPSVKKALQTMGRSSATRRTSPAAHPARIQTDFADSVNHVFQNPPKAAMVIEGDFVPGGRRRSKAKAEDRLQRVPVPVDQRLRAVGRDRRRHDRHVQRHPGDRGLRQVPGDVATRRRPGRSGAASRPATRTCRERLPGRDHEEDGRRRSRRRRASCSTCPTSSRPRSARRSGQGEWGIFQDFLRNPSDVNGIAQKLETAAAAAYKKGK